MCQRRKESVICLSQDWKWDGRGMLFRQISALVSLHPHILILLLLSVLSLRWEISAFSWVIHRCLGLPQSAEAPQLVTVTEMHWAHAEAEHIAYTVCTHTIMFNITHTHIGWLSLKSQDFPPQLFWSDIIPLLMKDSLSAIPSSSSLSVSLAHTRSLNHTSSISVRTFLLFPRQQWQRILPRRTQPMMLAVVLVVVLLGSVELAACVCACFRFMRVCWWT